MRTPYVLIICGALLLPLQAKDSWYHAPLLHNLDRINDENRDLNNLSDLIPTLENRHPLATIQFLNRGGHVSVWDQNGQTLIALLLENGYRGILTRVTTSLTPFDELRQITRHPLLRNIYLTHMRFNSLLQPDELSPFLQSVWDGNMKKFLNLLSAEKIEQKNHLGQTPLMLAAAQNHVAMLKVLLQAGADTTQHDRFGYTALAYATYQQSQQAIGLLLEAKASPYAGIPPQLSPLFITLVQDNRALAKRFYRNIDTVKAIDQRGELGETLLMYAAIYGSLYHVKQLLRLGAQASIHTTRGRFPLYYAAKGKNFSRADFANQYTLIEQALTQAESSSSRQQKLG